MLSAVSPAIAGLRQTLTNRGDWWCLASLLAIDGSYAVSGAVYGRSNRVGCSRRTCRAFRRAVCLVEWPRVRWRRRRNASMDLCDRGSRSPRRRRGHVSVRRFAHAYIMDSSALKDRLRLLQHATDVPVPAGSIAIRRLHVIDADVDPVAVEQWISRNGGQVIPAPEPIMSGEPQWRPSSHNALAYVFPSNLLD